MNISNILALSFSIGLLLMLLILFKKHPTNNRKFIFRRWLLFIAFLLFYPLYYYDFEYNTHKSQPIDKGSIPLQEDGSNRYDYNGEKVRAKPIKQVSKLMSIPRVTASDIYLNFTNKGFELTKSLNTEQCNWICTSNTLDYNASIDIIGKDPDRIYQIVATYYSISNPDAGEAAKDFLGYIGTMKYENAEPQRAKQWIVENINSRTSTIFGGVKFEIYPRGQTRMLIIGVGD